MGTISVTPAELKQQAQVYIQSKEQIEQAVQRVNSMNSTIQEDFITSHYDKTLDDLKSYQPKQLSKAARFVLASSSINLGNLGQTQKALVLNNISSTTYLEL